MFDENNDELSYFVLFMDSKNATNFVKFLLDLNNFELTFTSKNKFKKCEFCESNQFTSNNNCSCIKNFSQSKFFSSFFVILRYIYLFINKKDVAQDALSIYSKYISKDAKYSIELPDEIIKTTICKYFLNCLTYKNIF